MRKLLIGLFVFFVFVLLAEGIIYWRLTKSTPLSLIPFPQIQTKPGEYQVTKKIEAYRSPKEIDQVGDILPGRYFTVIEQKDGWLKIKTTRYESSWEGWIKYNPQNYQPVKPE